MVVVVISCDVLKPAEYLILTFSAQASRDGTCAYPAVRVVEPDDELLEDPSRLLLRQSPMWPVAQRVVEQVPPLRILHRYRQVRGGQEHLRAHAATASAHVLTHAGLACAPGAGGMP